MNTMPWLVSVGLILAGVFFGGSSRGYGGETHWGSTLIGVVCLGLGTGFAYRIWDRETGRGPAKGPRDPLD